MALLLLLVPCSFSLPSPNRSLQFPRTHATNSSKKRIWRPPQPLARPRRQLRLPATGSQLGDAEAEEEEEEEEEETRQRGRGGGDYVTLTACAVGLFTGLAVVLFNYAVHEIRDLTWDGIPLRGASWLREEPIQHIWQRVVFVPAFGGVIVAILNTLRTYLNKGSKEDSLPGGVLKAVAASVTLGTANSLGPEGPSVEIGSQIAKGFGNLFQWSGGKRLSLIAAGSAAGISSGFNAAVAGCFFAVESVLWPSSAADPSSSLPNATPIVILSSVIASVISEIGLGSDPAFVVPQYDFRSPTELPLYLLLGLLCGLVSAALTSCTSLSVEAVERLHQKTGLSKAVFPALGGLFVGIMALKYPEVLYWGFENVDILLESRPFTAPLSAPVLFQLVGVKIVATSLCRASGLVGGYYAPSIFIGGATGMAYGRFLGILFGGPGAMIHLPLLEVASPQAYGLVGMAATLAGVCQVPLTSVLLLFELTQDYRIVLPLLGAVGISSWISSSWQKRSTNYTTKANYAPLPGDGSAKQSNTSSNNTAQVRVRKSHKDEEELCTLESSLCLYDEEAEFSDVAQSLNVSEAMKRRYESVVSMETPIVQLLNVMIEEKQPFVVITNNDNFLLGLLTLDDVLEFIAATRQSREISKLVVRDICISDDGGRCRARPYVTPDMRLVEARNIMNSHRVDYIPVVSSHKELSLVGYIDRESISTALRASAAKEFLSSSLTGKT
ncbi:Chloride channel protein [Rhynchospora pubera]|uniref:Chloride channel protein n=1 Tax=Rhynchospora pubera TaxID=906938 RepID=A0AAV8C1U0_9POAL|nr:Chloride channel protein [Rhynchospora pubera]